MFSLFDSSTISPRSQKKWKNEKKMQFLSDFMVIGQLFEAIVSYSA